MTTIRRIPLVASVLFAVALGVRLLDLSLLSASPYWIPDSGDARFYEDWALRILRGEWTDGMAFYGLPGYPYLLAGFYWVFGKDPFLVGAFQATLDAGTAALIFLISHRIFQRDSLATVSREPDSSVPATTLASLIPSILAALGYAFLQPAQAFSIILMPTALAVFAFWWLLWVAMRLEPGTRNLPWVSLACGTVIGITSTAVGTMMALAPLFVLRCFQLGGRRWTKGAALALLLLLGIFAGAAPCWMHNRFIAHDPVFLSAHSGINFYLGNHPGATGYPHIPEGLRAGQSQLLEDSITVAERTEGKPLKRGQVSKFWSDQATSFIHSHPADWLRLTAAKIGNFFNRFEYDDLSSLPIFRAERLVLPGLRYGDLALLALPGVFIGVWRYPQFRLTACAILLLLAALLPVFVTERYRLSAAPGLAISAGIFIHFAFRLLRRRNWLGLSACAAGIALSALIVFAPRSPDILGSLIPYNYGIQALAAGDLDKAQANLEEAIAISPESAEVNFGVGNLWMAKNDTRKARGFYRKTIELDPRHDRAYNNLGVVASMDGRPDLAVKFLETALTLKPDDGEAHYLMARELGKLSRPEEALSHLEEAERFLGDRRELRELRRELGNPQTPADTPP